MSNEVNDNSGKIAMHGAINNREQEVPLANRRQLFVNKIIFFNECGV